MFSLLIVACGGKNPGAYTVGEAGSGDASAAAEADALFAQRDDRAQLEAALAKYEEAYRVDPTNRHVAVQLTRGYYFLGDAFETDMEAKGAQWQTSIEWGKKCIAINSEFTALLEKGDEDERSAIEKVATKDDVPCLYWTATSLGKWAKSKGLSTLLKHKDTVKKYIETVEKHDPEFFYGAADRYWGAYYSALPSFAGRDSELSLAKFEKSLAMAPNSLSTKVLQASYWAVGTQNFAEFDRLLCEVVNADAEFEEIGPENRAEQRKAEALIASRSDLFAEAAPAAECVKPEPVVEEPAVEEPAVEEPAVEEPAVEEPAAEEGAEGEAAEGEAAEGEATEGEAAEGAE
jgi:hypothetical protein